MFSRVNPRDSGGFNARKPGTLSVPDSKFRRSVTPHHSNTANRTDRRRPGFCTDERGSLTIFTLFIFVLMLMVSGLAIDVMRHEATRTKLQNTLDRAILAAADIDQNVDPELVVRDYFAKAGMSPYLVSVTVDQRDGYRNVSAEASADIDTLFMRLMGIDRLNAPAAGVAEEGVTSIEISLVLDISGSMGRNNKIDNLRVAAKEFVDAVVRDEARDLVSLSLVPYTAQVNAGPDILNHVNLATVPTHNYSHCLDFAESDFQDTGLNSSVPYQQMQHFEYSSRSYSSGKIGNPGCPQQDYERIVPLAQDRNVLKDTIDNYRARANTAIHIGMKWGTVLLDPSTNGMVQNLVTNGVVDPAFNDRPAPWNDSETMKVVVLMTDGENVPTYRIESEHYDSAEEYARWDQYPLWRYLRDNVPSWQRDDYYYRAYSASDADTMLDNICDASKAAGVTVFTIGFEVGNHGANVMQNCASSPSHFFRVEGTEISSAFSAIARQINQLRLTQ